MSLISKAFSDIITFSRSSNATRVGPDGTVQYAPHNLLTYSEQLDTGSWVSDPNRGTISANALAAPNGTVTADKLIAGSGGFGYRYQNLSIANSTVYTSSAYFKAGELSFGYIETPGGGITYFNLSTGVVSSTGSGTTASIVSVGNGWYRCVATFTSNTTSGYINLGAANASGSQAATNGSGIYLWGAQFSLGSIAGDYTPTTSAAVYGPRFDYDPVTLAAKGLLIEEQRTNLITYSEQFDNAAWTKNNTTITANTVIAPDGTLTGDLVAGDGATATHYVLQYEVSSQVKTASIYAMKGSSNFLQIGFDAYLGYANFDLNAGTVATTSGGATASIQAVGNGWYRCSCTANTTSATTTRFVLVSSGSAGRFESWSTSGNIFIWGAEIEAGAFATSYIPTVASTVTRSADVASVNTLSPWFNATEGTIYTEINRYADSVNVRGTIFHDGTVNNYMGSSEYTFSGQGGVVVAGGVTQATMGAGSTSVGIKKKAFAYKTNDFALSENGASVLTDTSGTIPTVTTLGIASLTSSNVGTGHIRRIAYYPRRLTNAELQTLTA